MPPERLLVWALRRGVACWTGVHVHGRCPIAAGALPPSWHRGPSHSRRRYEPLPPHAGEAKPALKAVLHQFQPKLPVFVQILKIASRRGFSKYFHAM